MKSIMQKFYCYRCIIWCTISCLLILSLIIPDTVSAQEIKVVTENFPPYNYEEDGKLTGMATEVVQATLRQANIEAEIKLYPWARAYKMALEQENVLIYTISMSPEREDQFKWIGPIVPSLELSLYKLSKRTDIQISTLEDAKKYKMGVVRDDRIHQYFKARGFEDNKHLYLHANSDKTLMNLFRERIELKVGDNYQQPQDIEALGYSKNDVEKLLSLIVVDFYMAFSKETSDEIVEQVRAAFEQVKADGKVDAIVKTYMPSTE